MLYEASVSSNRPGSTAGETTSTGDLSFVYQSEQDSDAENETPQRKRARTEPSRWDGQGSFELDVDLHWTWDGHDMSSLLLEYAKEFLEIGTLCPDRASKV